MKCGRAVTCHNSPLYGNSFLLKIRIRSDEATRVIAAVILCLAALIVPSCTAAGTVKDSAVTVVGTGESFWQARQDCIRQALQQTVAQLVIADRRIENDRITRDSIISTMNGFVDSFEVLKQYSDHGRVQLEAKVTVSVSGIENFVLSSNNGSTHIDSNTLLGNLDRDELARESNSQMISRLLDGFPSRALEVEIRSVAPDPNAKNTVRVVVSIKINKEFVHNLKTALKHIAYPGQDDYKTPDVLKLCFDSSDTDLLDHPRTDCWTTKINTASLKQQTFGSGGWVAFLVWFTAPDTKPLLIPAAYLRKASAGFESLGLYTGDVVFSSKKGLGNQGGGAIFITEGTRLFEMQIPKTDIPPGAKEIHAVPFFVDVNKGNDVLTGLFSPAVQVKSAAFEQIIDDLRNGR